MNLFNKLQYIGWIWLILVHSHAFTLITLYIHLSSYIQLEMEPLTHWLHDIDWGTSRCLTPNKIELEWKLLVSNPQNNHKSHRELLWARAELLTAVFKMAAVKDRDRFVLCLYFGVTVLTKNHYWAVTHMSIVFAYTLSTSLSFLS